MYLERLPTQPRYEKSFSHPDVVSHVLVTKTDFVITASVDGHIKFWKKTADGIEFIKRFQAHLGEMIEQIQKHYFMSTSLFHHSLAIANSPDSVYEFLRPLLTIFPTRIYHGSLCQC